jgi:hypothetical protein
LIGFDPFPFSGPPSATRAHPQGTSVRRGSCGTSLSIELPAPAGELVAPTHSPRPPGLGNLDPGSVGGPHHLQDLAIPWHGTGAARLHGIPRPLACTLGHMHPLPETGRRYIRPFRHPLPLTLESLGPSGHGQRYWRVGQISRQVAAACHYRRLREASSHIQELRNAGVHLDRRVATAGGVARMLPQGGTL